jgi:hypothetical protein
MIRKFGASGRQGGRNAIEWGLKQDCETAFAKGIRDPDRSREWRSAFVI